MKKVNKYLAWFPPSCRAAIVVNLACAAVSKHEVIDGVLHTDGMLGNSNSHTAQMPRGRPNAFINSQMAATESFAKVCATIIAPESVCVCVCIRSAMQ